MTNLFDMEAVSAADILFGWQATPRLVAVR